MITKKEIYKIIEREWPLHTSELIKLLNLPASNEREYKKSLARLKYHLNKLSSEEKIVSKKLGRSLVFWPTKIEKLRVAHELLEGLF